MKLLRMTVVLALCAVPMALSAQGGFGGMGGMGGGRRGGMGGGRGGMGGERGDRSGASAPAMMKFPAAKELEKLNPADLLANEHKKLHLSDSSVTALAALKLRIFERNGDLMAQYDSLQREYASHKSMPRGEGDSTQARERREFFQQMQSLRNTLMQLSDRRKTDDQEALAMVPDDRKPEAAKMLDKLDVKFGDLIPQPPARRGDDRGSEGRRGDRPPE